jgi:glutamyl-tRNA synthetase
MRLECYVVQLLVPCLQASVYHKGTRSVSSAIVTCAAAEVASMDSSAGNMKNTGVRVRFAPSPTGNLHIGGARTALFNWLYAKNQGGTMVLRIEDTDKARSTLESEQAVLRDLAWLGIKWDEGPDVGGPFGPYRQSERKDIYKQYVDQLVEAGVAYPCFCSDEELEKMKAEAEEKKLPPIYRGKWATASKEEVEAEMAKGTPYCYRFRVPKNEIIKINDIVRGEVKWNTDTLGDFVLLRSNGLPVYNFCVAIDDASMKITHVLRAEEHLPNTLRQVLIYKALGFPIPTFGHMSLILAPDKSKLSKRHGATSVGEFKEEGFLAPAMVNFLSLLGWNDGTEQEIFTEQELCDKFTLDRITKSGAVFDKTKLSWMNGQHLRALDQDTMQSMVGQALKDAGLVKEVDSPFAKAAVEIVSSSLELVNDAEKEVVPLLGYPLDETLASEPAKKILEDDFVQVAKAVLEAYDAGDLQAAIAGEPKGFKDWINSIGKAQERKGKRLFMPIRIALTGRMQGPDVGDVMRLLALESGDVQAPHHVLHIDDRMSTLRSWVDSQ